MNGIPHAPPPHVAAECIFPHNSASSQTEWTSEGESSGCWQSPLPERSGEKAEHGALLEYAHTCNQLRAERKPKHGPWSAQSSVLRVRHSPRCQFGEGVSQQRPWRAA